MNKLLAPERRKEIQQRANEILEKYPDIEKTAFLLQKIAEDNGIEILESDLFDISGALRYENGKWRIYVNKDDSNARKIFTIAHELGHYFMHSEGEKEFVDGQFVMNRAEVDRFSQRELEANEFAGNLVMPEQEIRKRLDGQNPTQEKVLELAKKFNVSALAMATRLRNLDIHVPE